MRRAVIFVVSLAAIVALALVAIVQLGGRPVSTDLSRLGQGTPALVLAHENYAPASMAALDHLNRLCGDYGDRIACLVADTGAPEGRDFAARHGLAPGSAVLLARDGTVLAQHSLVEGGAAFEDLLAAKMAALDRAM